MRLIGWCVMALGVTVLTGCGGRHASSGGDRLEGGGLVTSASGLAYVVVRAGDGPAAAWGDLVTVHESTGHLDGRVVFSTSESGQPISFTLGADQVVDGLEELLVGMRVGEVREAVMPPAITRRSRYPEGRDGQPPVFGPDDTLRYSVELVGIGSSDG